jgi:tetratricopeptide (TPR) repeat protein
MEIAEHLDEFEAVEPRAAYLERAKLLAPGDPVLWERCGDLELRDGHPDRAWMSWRRSLGLSEGHLPRILARSGELLGPDEIVRRVLPDRPGLLLKAALELYPRPAEGRRPFLERALALLEERRGPVGAADLHLRASIDRALGRPAEALAAYRASLDREPLELTWRYELADLLYEQSRYEEAFQELLKIRLQQPENDRARALIDAVKAKIAEGR